VGDMAQLVEHLPSKSQALSSNPNNTHTYTHTHKRTKTSQKWKQHLTMRRNNWNDSRFVSRKKSCKSRILYPVKIFFMNTV
jgi:hypothetical protein